MNVTLRENRRTFTAIPGELEGVIVGAGCRSGEVVVGGGISFRDAALTQLTIVSLGMVFDGRGSGWEVTWVNNTAAEITATAGVAAECVLGTMTLGA